MKTTTIFSCLVTAAATTSVSYDPGYDDKSRSMTAVSCSDGVNGLITKYGWQTQGAIPDFPYIGGSDTIAGWNSPSCGECFAVTWNGRTIHMLAIDHTATGLNMAEEAMNDLTGGQAVFLGRIDGAVVVVDVGLCGV
ncbi:hypothetical protein B0A55_04293 [Friedmanniomyces simplex]|uniref:Protein SnodProt1 n=1 Tax=Friedmanniomyces simplex TaxID=329884 RepID=A0A4V5NER4_9PEZI|nr:hypothetical protein B0A55_04293 [Friedmanniomyces simplex]